MDEQDMLEAENDRKEAAHRREQQRKDNLVATFIVTFAILAFFAIISGLWVGSKTISRSQKRADASNQVSINEIQIKQTHQLVDVQKQKAQIKIEEARGIAEAQRLINNTLTPLYLQHEAIQSQETQSNKIIYVPSGNQGIPMVQTVNP